MREEVHEQDKRHYNTHTHDYARYHLVDYVVHAIIIPDPRLKVNPKKEGVTSVN